MPSMTAIVRGRVSTRWAMKSWIKTDNPVSTGRNTIPRMNDFVRTAEPNSVDATTQIFRKSACNRGLLYRVWRGDPHEDVVQRRAA